MANPSTTGSGTEVLRRAYIDGMGASEVTLLTVATNHIYIVTSIIFLNRSTSVNFTFNMYVDYDSGGSADNYILLQQSLPFSSSFVFNERLVLSSTDKLHANGSSSSEIDIHINFIDQDFS